MGRVTVLAAAAGTVALIAAITAQSPTNAGEWRFYGGDAASTKYSPPDLITRDNLQRLEIAWRWNSPDNEIAEQSAVTRPGQH